MTVLYLLARGDREQVEVAPGPARRDKGGLQFDRAKEVAFLQRLVFCIVSRLTIEW